MTYALLRQSVCPKLISLKGDTKNAKIKQGIHLQTIGNCETRGARS